MKTIIKKTKYLSFEIKEQKPKKLIISIINRNEEEEIGTIEWYSNWRQYCFYPEIATVWNNGCLTDVIEVIKKLMQNRKISKPKYEEFHQ